ncbi:MAG: hypothetical protein AAFQ79_13135 [Pseudomonadota bacterium]
MTDDTPAPTRDTDVARYLYLTRVVLPAMARAPGTRWPVREDHCFQRIVLDTICGGVWYDHIPRPAYRHLTAAQARDAVRLCEGIETGTVDLHCLNAQSLGWRGKGKSRSRSTPA